MTTWLYQMNPAKIFADGGTYTIADFQNDLATPTLFYWRTRNIIPKTQKPKAGDTILYWFVAAGTENPGLYGLGVIFGFGKREEEGAKHKEWISHLPVYPSKQLRKNPLYNAEIKKLINKVRNKQQSFGTMFKIDNNDATKLFNQIQEIVETE